MLTDELKAVRDEHVRTLLERRGVTSEDEVALALESLDVYVDNPDEEVWGRATAREVVKGYRIERFALR